MKWLRRKKSNDELINESLEESLEKMRQRVQMDVSQWQKELNTIPGPAVYSTSVDWNAGTDTTDGGWWRGPNAIPQQPLSGGPSPYIPPPYPVETYSPLVECSKCGEETHATTQMQVEQRIWCKKCRKRMAVWEQFVLNILEGTDPLRGLEMAGA